MKRENPYFAEVLIIKDGKAAVIKIRDAEKEGYITGDGQEFDKTFNERLVVKDHKESRFTYVRQLGKGDASADNLVNT